MTAHLFQQQKHLQVMFSISSLLLFYEETEKDIKLEMDWEYNEVDI